MPFVHFELFVPTCKLKFRKAEHVECFNKEDLYQHSHYVQEVLRRFFISTHDIATFHVLTNHQGRTIDFSDLSVLLL